MYLAWAAFYEGGSDRSYFDELLPRLLEEIARTQGSRSITIPANPAISLGQNGRTIEAVAAEICDTQEAFHIVFVHADTGGRALAAGLSNRSAAYCRAANELCGWPCDRCIVLAPRHETEAWALADPTAVTEALGYTGLASSIGLPADAAAAERLGDPKAVLAQAAEAVRGRRRRDSSSQLLTTIAQGQDLAALRQSPSFVQFENRLRVALVSVGCLDRA